MEREREMLTMLWMILPVSRSLSNAECSLVGD